MLCFVILENYALWLVGQGGTFHLTPGTGAIVSISGQGRVMVFNRNGLPIGQIVLPDRDKGRNLKSTSLAIRPGHRELFIVANSGTEPGGAMIFRSGAFAPAPLPFSHQ